MEHISIYIFLVCLLPCFLVSILSQNEKCLLFYLACPSSSQSEVCLCFERLVDCIDVSAYEDEIKTMCQDLNCSGVDNANVRSCSFEEEVKKGKGSRIGIILGIMSPLFLILCIIMVLIPITFRENIKASWNRFRGSSVGLRPTRTGSLEERTKTDDSSEVSA